MKVSLKEDFLHMHSVNKKKAFVLGRPTSESGLFSALSMIPSLAILLFFHSGQLICSESILLTKKLNHLADSVAPSSGFGGMVGFVLAFDPSFSQFIVYSRLFCLFSPQMQPSDAVKH